MRPFVLGAKVNPRGCSRPLQRAIVDFAADDPFAQVPLKLREHYGFEIGESTIQRVTLGHAQAIFESEHPSAEFPKTPGKHKQIVAQTDGGMIPIMEPDADQNDKRKGKKAVVERGEDFACTRQGKPHAGLRRRDRRRRGDRGAAPPRVCGAGGLRDGFARARGRGRRAVDRRPG